MIDTTSGEFEIHVKFIAWAPMHDQEHEIYYTYCYYSKSIHEILENR